MNKMILDGFGRKICVSGLLLAGIGFGLCVSPPQAWAANKGAKKKEPGGYARPGTLGIWGYQFPDNPAPIWDLTLPDWSTGTVTGMKSGPLKKVGVFYKSTKDKGLARCDHKSFTFYYVQWGNTWTNIGWFELEDDITAKAAWALWEDNGWHTGGACVSSRQTSNIQVGFEIGPNIPDFPLAGAISFAVNFASPGTSEKWMNDINHDGKPDNRVLPNRGGDITPFDHFPNEPVPCSTRIQGLVRTEVQQTAKSSAGAEAKLAYGLDRSDQGPVTNCYHFYRHP
jgi:hypothetical protein